MDSQVLNMCPYLIFLKLEGVMLNVLLSSQTGIMSIVTVLGSVIAVAGWTIFMFSKHKGDK